ncbi:MAG: DUF3788 family protein [Terriglobales bacterium]
MPAKNAFIGKTRRPTRREIAAELGASMPVWDGLLLDLRRDFHLKPEWHSYSVNTGWMMRFKSGKRNALYISPLRGHIRTALILGDKAVKSALASQLPARAKRLVRSGTRYAEGTAVRMLISDSRGSEIAKQLVAIKLAN